MLEQPPSDKMMRSAPAKKEFHFAATAERLAEVVWAETIEEAEAVYQRVKRRIAPDSTPELTEEAPPQQSTPAAEPEAPAEAVQ
jgi:hypothetical protein